MRLSMPPTAIFSCNNRMTLGLMRALSEVHVHCPEAVSVLGFDDFEWSAYFTPRLTTIAQPAYEMGTQAMQILLRRLQAPAENNGLNDETPGTVIRLKTELRVRDSTTVPASVCNVQK
jgi:LacI family transcriptional regulator